MPPILRPFLPSDLEPLHRLLSDPAVMRFLEPPFDIEQTRQFLLENGLGPHPRLMAVETDGAFAGYVIFHPYDDTAYEIGWVLSPACWGKGLAGQCTELLIQKGQALGQDLVIECVPEQKATVRLAQKFRFQPTGSHEGLLVYRLPCPKKKEPQPMDTFEPLILSLEDTQWPHTYIDHDRVIVRAIVVDENGLFRFVEVRRNDGFGKATLIETSGGGVEENEDLITAIHRELREELGASVTVLCKLGVVDDRYNLIHRRNINHFFLCKALSFGQTHMTEDEISSFHLKPLTLTFDEALTRYEKAASSKLGRLISAREVPMLRHAKAWLDARGGASQRP